MLTLKNVLVATDLGDGCEETIRYGREFAARFGARLHVLHAIEPMPLDLGPDGLAPGAGLMPPMIFELDELEKAEKSRLESLLSASDKTRLQATTKVETMDTPAHAIVQYAKDHAIDLIVIGTHDKGALARLFTSSVGDRVVHTAPCPVLAVPQSLPSAK